jgi:hypothetical protein
VAEILEIRSGIKLLTGQPPGPSKGDKMKKILLAGCFAVTFGQPCWAQDAGNGAPEKELSQPEIDATLYPEVNPRYGQPAAVDAPSESATAVPRPAVLRMEAQPKFEWLRRPKDSVLQSAQVQVRNSGGTKAEQVQVIATLGKNPPEAMSGPSEIAPNQVATYTYSGNTMVAPDAGQRVNIQLSCANCRR